MKVVLVLVLCSSVNTVCLPPLTYPTEFKDEFVLVIISAPIIVLMWAVMSDDPAAMEKVKLFFEYFQSLPSWFTNLWILVVASIFGIKGTQIFRNGKK